MRGRPRWSIQAEARPLQTGRGVLSGAPDCASALYFFSLYCLRPHLTDTIYYFLHHTRAGAGRRSATSGAGARAERPASLSMPLRGNEVIKSTALKARCRDACTVARASCGLMYWNGCDNGNEHLGSPACRGPVQGGTLPHPSGAWEGARVLADKPAHGYAGRRLAPAADAVGKAAALRSCGLAVLWSWHVVCKVYIF